MNSQLERLMAAMAINAYRPSEENTILLQAAGWTEVSELSRPNRGDGFDAVAFRSENGQIVIAFRGTDGGDLRDWDDNIQIANGNQSKQVEHAIEMVVDVMIAYPDADIQFTGHSLGGGLASLMSVYFSRTAYVFAPAPFEFSATNKLAISVTPDQSNFSDTDLAQRYHAHYISYLRSRNKPGSASPAFQEYSRAFGEGVSVLGEHCSLLVKSK